MTTEEINKRNNAILAVMGGPESLRSQLSTDMFREMQDDEFVLTGPEDLKYHKSWDWLIPAWSKFRHALSPGMIISAISFIDEAELENLWKLLSQVAMTWCKDNNLKYE
jgi:hypothetical protein